MTELHSKILKPWARIYNLCRTNLKLISSSIKKSMSVGCLIWNYKCAEHVGQMPFFWHTSQSSTAVVIEPEPWWLLGFTLPWQGLLFQVNLSLHDFDILFASHAWMHRHTHASTQTDIHILRYTYRCTHIHKQKRICRHTRMHRHS
jgi:hypothetical protein